MRKTIKDKTQLRQLIKNSIDTTIMLDSIEFYDDWNWEIMSVNTWSTDRVFRCGFGRLTKEWSWGMSLDQNITMTFQEIERHIIEVLDGNMEDHCEV